MWYQWHFMRLWSKIAPESLTTAKFCLIMNNLIRSDIQKSFKIFLLAHNWPQWNKLVSFIYGIKHALFFYYRLKILSLILVYIMEHQHQSLSQCRKKTYWVFLHTLLNMVGTKYSEMAFMTLGGGGVRLQDIFSFHSDLQPLTGSPLLLDHLPNFLWICLVTEISLCIMSSLRSWGEVGQCCLKGYLLQSNDIDMKDT